MGDHPLDLSEDRLSSIRRLRATTKFLADPDKFYPGAPNEGVRVECEALIDEMLERLLEALQVDPRKAIVLEVFGTALESFYGFESEERDRVCWYLEELMDISGIESSDGLLNRWRYGFDPNEALPDA